MIKKLSLSYLHAILFTIAGVFIVGWPFASARWYITYLIGLILVWTLPVSAKKNHLWGYITLVIAICAKVYFYYITPVVDVQTIPIVMYKRQLVQQHPSISQDFEKLLNTKFSKDIDLCEKNPKLPPPTLSNTKCTYEPILFNFKVGHNYVDHSKIWTLPIEIEKAFSNEVPVILSVHVKSAKRGTLWPSGIFFEEKTDKTIKTYPEIYLEGIKLKNHEGSTFFMPFVGNLKSKSWIYIEICPWSVYIPLLLLIAAILLCDLTLLPDKASQTIEQLVCLSFAFLTISISDVMFWNKTYESVYELSNWIHNGSWPYSANKAPIWFSLHKFFYQATHFGYLVPILCFWSSAWILLQLLRQFFTRNQTYILWGLLLTTPWLAKQGIGLHIYYHWYTSYNSLMLGMPLFLLGLLGYFKKFNITHAIAWIIASLCSPVLSAGIYALLLHKHIGKYRFIYLGLCLGLYILFDYNYLWSFESLLDNPLSAWLINAGKHGIHNTYFNPMVNYLTQIYSFFFTIIVLIPNILMAFSDHPLKKRFARAALIMHGSWILDGKIVQDAYLACTLSGICSIIYLFPYYEQLLTFYNKLAAKSQ